MIVACAFVVSCGEHFLAVPAPDSRPASTLRSESRKAKHVDSTRANIITSKIHDRP